MMNHSWHHRGHNPLHRIVDILIRRGWSPPAAGLMLGGVVAGVGVVVGFVLLSLHLYTQAVDDRTADLEGAALMLAAQADSSLQALESVQNGLIEQMHGWGIKTTQDYAAAVATPELQRRLHDQVSALPYVGAVALTDSRGKLLNVSRVWPPPDINLADRDYYKALSTASQSDRYVSEPVLNRVNGAASFYLARRFNGRDGSFLGVVLGAVNLDYFQRFFAEVAPARDASAGMYRTDGLMLVRHPAVDPLIGKAQRVISVKSILASDHGMQRIISPSDGLDRLVVGRSLAHYPILVIVSRTVEATLQPWREQTRIFVVIATLIDLSIAGFVLLWIRHSKRGLLLTQARAFQAEAEAERVAADERERHGRALAAYYSRFDIAVSNMSQGLCLFDAQDQLIVANPRLGEMFNLAPEATTSGNRLGIVANAAWRTGSVSVTDIRAARAQLRHSRSLSARACFIWDLTDGRAFSVNYESMSEHGWLMTFEDITERRRTEAQIVQMAHHDALSGLPNRVLFHQRLAAAVAAARRGSKHALLCLDLDHFKEVNDTLGHPVGDALLKEVTARLLRCVRETDTVARLGGDEFAIIQSNVRQPLDVPTLAERLIETLSQPYELAGQQVVIGASIGIVLLPEHGLDPDELLKNADLALYRAKANGRGCHCVFTSDMEAISRLRRRLETDLRRAVALQQFELHYQPLINVGLRRICGFEALLRWPCPDRVAAGLAVGPDTFIPLAEEIGLIVPLGEWVIRTACTEAAKWPDDLKIAVNLSAVQFRSRDLVDTVAAALAASGLAPERLELEITETVLLKNTANTLKTLHRLRDLGVQIAMDDFGTGHSSLSYLRMFPFDKVKIDRSFVRSLGEIGERAREGADCSAIVGAVTVMCRDLGIASLAEGVETAEQLLALEQKNCTEVQGFLFSRAVPGADIPVLLAAPHHETFVPRAVAALVKAESWTSRASVDSLAQAAL